MFIRRHSNGAGASLTEDIIGNQRFGQLVKITEFDEGPIIWKKSTPATSTGYLCLCQKVPQAVEDRNQYQHLMT